MMRAAGLEGRPGRCSTAKVVRGSPSQAFYIVIQDSERRRVRNKPLLIWTFEASFLQVLRKPLSGCSPKSRSYSEVDQGRSG